MTGRHILINRSNFSKSLKDDNIFAMIAISQQYVLDIQARFDTEIRKQHQDAVDSLRKLSSVTHDPTDSKFIGEVLDLFENDADLLTRSPKDLEGLARKLKVPVDAMPNGSHKRRGIGKDVLNALDYKGLRDTFYPGYFAAIGIKACIYCNSQLTISVVKTGKKYSGRFDVDHYLAKDEYPWLSISLFNLYPACAPCNRRKSERKIKFDLYSDDRSLLSRSDFKFRLDAFAKARYILSKDPRDLVILFTEPECQKGFDRFEDAFKISGIYGTQLDVVEELIAKAQMYDDTYREMLRKGFDGLGIDRSVFERVILGNYVAENEIHKRPMSKFMQDIAKDIKLI